MHTVAAGIAVTYIALFLQAQGDFLRLPSSHPQLSVDVCYRRSRMVLRGWMDACTVDIHFVCVVDIGRLCREIKKKKRKENTAVTVERVKRRRGGGRRLRGWHDVMHLRQ